MRELRRILRRLEDEGVLIKGFMLKDSGVLHWASKEAFDMLGKTTFTGNVVLSPGHYLSQYLRVCFRDIMPETGRYAVFQGSKIIGSFEGKSIGGKLEIADVKGGPECQEIVSEYARIRGLMLSEREAGTMSDWEIIDFYQRTHPGEGKS